MPSKKRRLGWLRTTPCVILTFLAVLSWAGTKVPLRHRVLAEADRLLEEAQVSYVYGGSKLGDGQACDRCNSCLTAKSPRAALRLKECPACLDCSLDCSHFTELVYSKAGIPYPYLATAGMLALAAETLQQRYRLIDVGPDPRLARPGDLLVYDGHVVILERTQPANRRDSTLRGDVIHATGGRDIRLPGQGIQRERYVEIGHMRGPLRRILRHTAIAAEGDQTIPQVFPEARGPAGPVPADSPWASPLRDPVTRQAPREAKAPRLRPVEKRRPNED